MAGNIFQNPFGGGGGGAPAAHASTHQSGGSDAIKLDDLASPEDNTDLNVSISAHGLCPKLNNDNTYYLNGQGGWSVPAGGGGGDFSDGGDAATADRSLGNTTDFALDFLVNNDTIIRLENWCYAPKYDCHSDYWLDSVSNAFYGINIAALGNLTHSSGTEGWYNTIVGFFACSALTTAEHNSVLGSYAGQTWTTASYNTAIGYDSLHKMQDNSDATTITNCSGLGANTRVSGNNQVQLGDSSTTTYAYGAVQDRSDRRDKIDIKDCELGLDFILALKPRQFRMNHRERYIDHKTKEILIVKEVKDKDGKIIVPAKYEISREPFYIENDGSRAGKRFHNGFIADEVKAVADKLGKDFAGYQDHSINGGCDVKTIGYQEFISPLIKAVQELSVKVEKLEAKSNGR